MLNNKLKYSFFIVVISLSNGMLTGCEDKISEAKPVSGENTEAVIFSDVEMTPAEYIHWFKSSENHLRKSETVGDLRYTLEYSSPELLALQQLQSKNVTRVDLDSALSEIEGLVQFRLEIEVPSSGIEFMKHDLQDKADYEPRVKYFAFEMQKDISIINGTGDTLPCSMYHFERSYGVSPASVFLLGFSGIDLNKNLEIIITEKVFAKKEIRFVFNPTELKNIPQLKTL